MSTKQGSGKMPFFWKIGGTISTKETTIDRILELVRKELDAKKSIIDTKGMDDLEVEYALTVREL